MRGIALVALAACGPAATPPATPRPGTSDAGVVAVDAAVAPRESRAPVIAPTTGIFVTVAVSADGTAAIASDDTGSMRLFPALDGSAEPIVVDLPAAHQLALRKTATGFEVALRDQVNGLVVATLDRSGRILAHTSLEPDPAFAGVVASERGMLAWRVDHAIALVGADGAARARLAAEGGQQLVDVAANGTHAVAVLRVAAQGDKLRARLVDIGDDRLAWGAWLDGDVGDAIAVSPDGKRIASIAIGPNAPRVRIASVDGKKTVEASSPEAGDIGFVDDDHVVVGGKVTTTWLGTDGSVATRTLDTGSAVATQPAFATGAGVAVSGWGSDLALGTVADTRYLGYGLVGPTGFAATSGGRLLAGAATQLAVLDRELAATSSATLPERDTLYALRGVGDGDALVEAYTADSKVSLLYVAADGKTTVLRDGMPAIHLLLYEPTTDLVTLSYGEDPEILRLDRATHALAKVSTPARATPFAQLEVAPVAPALADGARIVGVEMSDRTRLTWTKDDAGKVLASTVASDGSIAAFDRSGRVYLWQNTGKDLALRVFHAGSADGTTFPAAPPASIEPDPTGAKVAEAGTKGLVVYDAGGKQLWRRDFDASGTPVWLDDGALALVTATGIVRFDGDTGAATASKCGWFFGLARKSHPARLVRTPPVCMLARHL